MFTFVRDHLGSVRAVVDFGGKTVCEESDYYTYGGKIPGCSATQLFDSRWGYSGKEGQSTIAGLPYLDYGARLYDTRTCRWLSPDPLAEKYYSLSPYAYCAGDPVNFVDPDGMDPIYQIRFFKPKLIGDDGKKQGMVYFVHGRAARDVKKTEQGKFYSGNELTGTRCVAIPYKNVKSYLEQSVEDAAKAGKEQGGHVLSNGAVTRWDAGDTPSISTNNFGEEVYTAHIAPFRVNGKVASGLNDLVFFWHVHPKVSIDGKFLDNGHSSPSIADIEHIKGLAKHNNYHGSAMVIGLGDQKVSLYNAKITCTISLEDFLNL